MAMEQEIKKEIKRISDSLSVIVELAQEATLSGAFEGGEKRCILQYNSVLKRLQEAIPNELFPPLEEDASFGEVGVACSFLAAYLKNEFSIVSLLAAIVELAQEATLSGAFEGGEKMCIFQYNNILRRLQDRIPDGLFPPLEADASFGEIGVACSILAAYLKNGENDKSDKSDKPLQDLKDLGKLIRQAMPDFLKDELKDEK